MSEEKLNSEKVEKLIAILEDDVDDKFERMKEVLNEGNKNVKEYYYFDNDGVIKKAICDNFTTISFEFATQRESIGNYFETRNDAEMKIRKLKAIKKYNDLVKSRNTKHLESEAGYNKVYPIRRTKIDKDNKKCYSVVFFDMSESEINDCLPTDLIPAHTKDIAVEAISSLGGSAMYLFEVIDKKR